MRLKTLTKKSFIAFFFLFTCSFVWAEPIDSISAKQAAANFFSGNSRNVLKKGSKQVSIQDVKLLKIRKSENDQTPRYFIFENQNAGGWLILSADDEITPVIAYSDEGNFGSEEDASPSYHWWMNGMMEEMEYLLQQQMANSQSGIQKAARQSKAVAEWKELLTTAVAERNSLSKPMQKAVNATYTPGTILVSAKWAQSNNFALSTPNNYVVGCVATATGQVMHYWGKKNNITALNGKGYYEYYDYGGTSFPNPGQKRSVNFNNRIYNLKNMPDVLSTSTNPRPNGANEISQLLADIGISVRMRYASGESGALNLSIPSALFYHFGFKPAEYIEKDDYNSSDWEAKIKTEINNLRPVIYGGRKVSGGGHSFVVDGYDNQNKFHFNWGWGGHSLDGFYILSLSGVNSNIAYTADQDAIIGIEPYAAGESLGYEISAKLRTSNGDCDVLNEYVKNTDDNYFLDVTIKNNTDEYIDVPLSVSYYAVAGETSVIYSQRKLGQTISVAPNSSRIIDIGVDAFKYSFNTFEANSFNFEAGIKINDSYVDIGRNERVIDIKDSYSSCNTRLYVNGNKSGASGDGFTWNTAMKDLSEALKHAQESKLKGVTIKDIWVAKGTYTPKYPANDFTAASNSTNRNNAFVMLKDLKIYGGFSSGATELSQRDWESNKTTLSGKINTTDSVYHVVISAGDMDNARLDGFTITEGNADTSSAHSIMVNDSLIEPDRGGGMYNKSSSFTIENVVVEKNKAIWYGGGMFNQYSQLKVRNAIIQNNKAGDSGGGIYSENDKSEYINIQILSNESGISKRTGSGGGGILNNLSQNNYINTVIAKNKSLLGAGICNKNSNDSFINVSIIENESSAPEGGNNGGGGISSSYTSNITIQNSIIWGNIRNGYIENVRLYDNSKHTYNNSFVEDGSIANGIILNGNPYFESGSYKLSSYSPAINAGNNSYNSETSDLAGNNRKYENIDLGAYEYQDVATTLSNGIMYVKQGGDKSGNKWSDAIDLADALNVASKHPGLIEEIWVAKGTYTPTHKAGNGTDELDKAFVLAKDIKIYGGFSGDETELSQRNWATNISNLNGKLNDSDSAYHVVIAAGDLGRACLDGFTISGGKADGSGSITINGQTLVQESGGGIALQNASPLLTNLIIEKNFAANDGGGIFCFDNSEPKIKNTILQDNKAKHGGGIICYTNASPILTNMEIKRNSATLGAGIRIVTNSNPVLTNVLIANNTAEEDGGGIFCTINSAPIFTNLTVVNNKSNANKTGGIATVNSSQSVMRNSIVWGNTPNNVQSNGFTSFAYSLVENMDLTSTDGFDGNLSENAPFFSDEAAEDYTLTSQSKCINAGNNSFFDTGETPDLSTITTDLAGNLRIYNNGNIDLGAYEYSQELPTDIESDLATTDIAVYPNPVRDVLYIDHYDSISKVIVCELSGRILMQKTQVENGINLSSLNKGIYLIQIETANGRITQKIVKE